MSLKASRNHQFDFELRRKENIESIENCIRVVRPISFATISIRGKEQKHERNCNESNSTEFEKKNHFFSFLFQSSKLTTITTSDILEYLDTNNELNTWTYSQPQDYDHQHVIGLVRSIEAMGDVRIFFDRSRGNYSIEFVQIVRLEQQTLQSIGLTAEGETIVKDGSYEFRVYQSIPVGKSVERAEILVRESMKRKRKT